MTSISIACADQWCARVSRPVPVEIPVTGALLCSPDHFDVIDVRNAHMEGQIGSIDKELALSQWIGLAEAIESIGLSIHLLDLHEHLIDAVFTANPSFVTSDADGNPLAIIGRMNHPNRTEESELHRRTLEQIGIRCQEITSDIEGCWEGNGDTLKHPGQALIWCGIGPRSELACHQEVGRMLDLDVAILQLPDPTFYHLDTALALLDGSCAAYIPAAFDDPGRTLLEAAFENLIEVDDLEAREVLAGNLWCPDGRHVLMSAGAPITRSRIESNGFQVLEIETGEFLKSGGSVFCMRQEIREQL